LKHIYTFAFNAGYTGYTYIVHLNDKKNIYGSSQVEFQIECSL
jgi:hypothetical protein